MAGTINRTLITLALAVGLILVACSSGTSAGTTSTTTDPADLPWVEDFRLDDTGGGEIAFGSDSSRLFMAGPATPFVRIWDLETRTRTELEIRTDNSQLAVSRDDVIALVVDLDESGNEETENLGLRLWNFETEKTLYDFSKRTGQQKFSLDGKLLAASGRTEDDVYELTIWNVETGETVQTLLGHADSIRGVEFTPDGEKLISASRDGTIRVWDVKTGRQVSIFDDAATKNSVPRSIAVSPDGKSAVTNNFAGNDAWLWDLETETIAKKLQPGIEMNGFYNFEFSPDGKQLAAGGGGVSILWDIETGEVIQEFPISDIEADVNVAFSPDGERLVVTDIADERGIGKYTVIYKRNPK